MAQLVGREELMGRVGRLTGHGLDAFDLRDTLEAERRHQSWLARHDALTGLLNRRGLTVRMEEAISRSRQQNRSLAVTFVSLNGFQALDELHGRPAVDCLLRAFASRLQGCLREGEAASRLNADDFVLVLETFQEDKLSARL
ncbi:MAG TPA: GGDEF domain-containing protein, partial [Acidobacteriaceae bacterium]|nr:GGDEF domain-containing protein [Acidobacteriaceae bacterium]